MIKEYRITKDEKLTLNSSAGWLYIYKEQFGHDILPDLLPVLEAALESVGKVTEQVLEKEEPTQGDYIMAMVKSEVIDDIILAGMGAELTTVLNIIWAMAKNADQTTYSPIDFYNQYENIEFDKLLPDVFKQILQSLTSKKKLLKAKANLKKLISTN